MTRLRAVAASVACAGLLLSGCSGDSSDDSSLEELDSDATPTATPTPAALKDIPKEPPTALKNETKSVKGAVEFVSYVVDLISYAVPTRDADPLLALDEDGTCTSCKALSDVLAEAEADEVREVRSGPITVKRVKVQDTVDPIWLFGVKVDIPAGKKINDDGRVVEALDADPNGHLTVSFGWAGDHWDLQEYRWD